MLAQVEETASQREADPNPFVVDLDAALQVVKSLVGEDSARGFALAPQRVCELSQAGARGDRHAPVERCLFGGFARAARDCQAFTDEVFDELAAFRRAR